MAITPPEVEAILKKQKLVEVTNVSSKFHNYASICTDKKGNLVYLKVRLYPKLVSHKGFIKETFLTKFLSDNFLRNKKFRTPKYYKSELNNKPQWLTREYTSGKRTGDVWGFNEDFSKKITPKKVADMLDFIRKEVTRKFREKNEHISSWLFEKHGSFYYKKYFTDFSLLPKKLISRAKKERAFKIFEKNQKFLSKNNIYLAHGDLHPGNLVVSDGKLIVHDWKYSHFDNAYFDFTFVWFLNWTNKKWRDELFNLEFKRAKDKDLFIKCFYLSVIKLTPKIITIFIQASKITLAQRKKGINSALSVFDKAVNYLDCGE